MPGEAFPGLGCEIRTLLRQRRNPRASGTAAARRTFTKEYT